MGLQKYFSASPRSIVFIKKRFLWYFFFTVLYEIEKSKIKNSNVWKRQNLEFQCFEEATLLIPMFEKEKLRIPMFGKGKITGIPQFGKGKLENADDWKKAKLKIPKFKKRQNLKFQCLVKEKFRIP